MAASFGRTSPRGGRDGASIWPGQVYVLGGDDGSLFFKTNELKDEHPGFPKEALVYHTITDTWVSAGPIPRNHVTTIPVLWDGRMIIASGEIGPRVRSASIWSVARSDDDVVCAPQCVRLNV